jgi:hypothetical protein
MTCSFSQIYKYGWDSLRMKYQIAPPVNHKRLPSSILAIHPLQFYISFMVKAKAHSSQFGLTSFILSINVFDNATLSKFGGGCTPALPGLENSVKGHNVAGHLLQVRRLNISSLIVQGDLVSRHLDCSLALVYRPPL